MKSIGARLAFWYALAATVTFACLSVVGYFTLEKHLIHGLDLLNAAEFQQILDHHGALGPLPYSSLAKLGLGRAFTQTGDLAKARIAYQDFFTLWKDADPDIPILKQAKGEYAKMQ